MSQHSETINPRGQDLVFFSMMVAITSMTHMVSFQWWSDLLTGWILCGTTLLLFVFPASVTVLCLFLLSSIYHWSTLLPLVPNHVFFEMIVHLTLLAAVLVCLSKRFYEAKSIGQEEGVFSAKVFSLVRPFVITELILLYLFTVVHKLNTDFFNPAVSCAVSMHHEVAQLSRVYPKGHGPGGQPLSARS